MHRAHGKREDGLSQLESLLRDRISRTYHPGPEDEQELDLIRARSSVCSRMDDLGHLDVRRCVRSFGRFNKSPKRGHDEHPRSLSGTRYVIICRCMLYHRA